MAGKYKITSLWSIWVRAEANDTSKITSVLYNNSIVTIEEELGGWYKIDKGWFRTSIDGKSTAAKIDESTISPPKTINLGSFVRTTDEDGNEVGTVISENTENNAVLIKTVNGEKIWKAVESVVKSVNNTRVVHASEAITKPAETDQKAPENNPENTKPQENPLTGYSEDVMLSLKSLNSAETDFLNSLSNLKISSTRGIFGMPYQFSPLADIRMSGNDFGVTYADRIVARMPLLLLTPGTPEFLKGRDAESKAKLLASLTGLSDDKTSIDEIVGREGKYYSLSPDRPQYFHYVNPMCRAVARFLGIGDMVVDGQSLNNYNWDEHCNAKINQSITYRQSIPFYLDSETQITDNFSNSTTESQLAGKVNDMSQMGRELQFILGTAGAVLDHNVKHGMDKDLDAQAKGEQLGTAIAGGGFIKNVMGSLDTIMAGGKLIFPEIWSDSDFTRSYDVSLKLVSPDADPLSLYLNLCVPTLHLMAMCLPRQFGVNGYMAPFIVRGFYRGLFNCDMGVITNMSVTKGANGSWTKYGMPTAFDINFTIKDLYSALSMSHNKNIKLNIMNNIFMMDYLANMCGVNINAPDIQRTVEMFITMNITNKISDGIRLSILGGMEQYFNNRAINIFRQFIR